MPNNIASNPMAEFWDWYISLFYNETNSVKIAAWSATLATVTLVINFIMKPFYASLKKRRKPEDNTTKKASSDSRGHRFEFSDGVVAYAKIRASWTIVSAMQFFKSFKSHDECTKAFASLVHARACYLLEKHPYAKAKDRRREVEIKLMEEMKAEYAKHGLRLDEITIGHFVRQEQQGNLTG